jgi:hypothetical protein
VEFGAGPVSNTDAFSTAALGYGSKISCERQIKECITSLVEGFAIAFNKGRGEM